MACLAGRLPTAAQFTPGTDPNSAPNLFEADSTGLDTMRLDWVDEPAEVYYTYLNTTVRQTPDTGIYYIQRFQHTQPWWGNHLGNYGTAARNLFFSPRQAIGLTLGYDVYDVYKLDVDSLRFYNTTRPYSDFRFMMGSKNEQHVSILHTQNITPGWNFAATMRSLSSEGFYQLQKANSLSGSLNSSFRSENGRYTAHAALVYNRFHQDENGGIVSDSLLDLPAFNDRFRIPVRLPAATNGAARAAVTNTWREATFFFRHRYAWGKTDTLFNEDSTRAELHFVPRFSLQHQLKLHSERHLFKDMQPDSLRYLPFFPHDFDPRDSVFSQQDWTSADNRFSLNGFLGKEESLASIQAGFALRLDHFQEYYVHERPKNTYLSNYLFGEIRKEALADKQWSYYAYAEFFVTGKAAGNFKVDGQVGKDMGRWGALAAGLSQSLGNAAFSRMHYKTNFFARDVELSTQSITRIWGSLRLDRLKLELTLNNYLLGNYLYFNEEALPAQADLPFSLFQLYGRKQFSFGWFIWDNELAWQQPTANAPLHLPALMLREQLMMETFIFKKALKVGLGLQLRYTTPYFVDAYSPYLNRYYLQGDMRPEYFPDVTAFFNFKVRNLRAYVVGDYLQHFLVRNHFNAPGYPAQNPMFRFGFSWVLIN